MISRYKPFGRQQHLVCVAAGVQGLQLALEGVVLAVQGMLLRVGTGLDHLHGDLDVTEGLGEGSPQYGLK